MAIKDKQQIAAIILSIFIAFILWLYVMGDKNPEQTKRIENIPVTLVNTSSIEQSDLALVPNQNFTVNLTIRGRTLDIVKVNADSFRIEADMGVYLKRGFNNIPVNISSMPKGISVVDRNPDIRVELDSLVDKSVPVIINITGAPAKDFGYLPAIVKPSSVLISGPERNVNSVANVVGQIDVKGISQDASYSVAIKAQDSEGRVVQNVKIEPNYVDVSITVKPAKEVPIVIKKSGELPQGKFLKSTVLDVDKVVIIGDKKNLDKINYIQTIPYDISTLNSSTSAEILLNIPSGVRIFNDIRSVNVSFTIENIIEKSINVPVIIENGRDEFEYRISTQSVPVILIGSESAINALDIKKLKAIIDVKNMEEGAHTLYSEITLPEGISIKDNQVLKIIVTVIKKQ